MRQQAPSPAVLQCPAGHEVFVRYGWELMLQAHTRRVKCICSTILDAPRSLMNPEAAPGDVSFISLRAIPWGGAT